MSNQHSGNLQNEILREEHDGDLNAKRVTPISSVTVIQGTVPWQSLATISVGVEFVSTIPFHGMVSAASGGLTQFPDTAMRWAILEGFHANATTIYVGASNATINSGYAIDPGQSVGISINNLNKFYLVGVGSPAEIRYIGGN